MLESTYFVAFRNQLSGIYPFSFIVIEESIYFFLFLSTLNHRYELHEILMYISTPELVARRHLPPIMTMKK
jgi:hypothetical protein